MLVAGRRGASAQLERDVWGRSLEEDEEEAAEDKDTQLQQHRASNVEPRPEWQSLAYSCGAVRCGGSKWGKPEAVARAPGGSGACA
jgi:hypothetical protein